MLKLVNVGKIYSQEGNVSVGIRKVNLELSVGEFVAITGESGSGKTTLLNVLSGIDNYEEGEMYVNGEETSYFSTEDLEDYRNKYVGFIFQNYNIIDSYTVRENVEAALLFNGYPKEKIRERAAELIEKVGLTHRIRTKSSKLSGGEKQRVVIARALAKDPVIIACDEPTGNLDYDSSKQIIELLHEVSKDKLVLIVTHDFEEVKDYATRVIRVFDSEIKEDRILRPHEETNINFEELKVNKPKRGQLLPFSFKDLFASPKRLIFNSIVFFVMALMVLVSIGFYRNQTRRSESYETFGQFYNQDTRRIVMNKKDKSYFTDAELNEIKNINGVDFIIENDILVDSKYNFSFGQADYNIYFDGYLLPASVLKIDQLAAGNAPTNEDEVVVSLKTSEIKNMGYKEAGDLVGKTANVYFPSKGQVTVSGVILSDNNVKGQMNYMYLYDNYYKDFYSYVFLTSYGYSSQSYDGDYAYRFGYDTFNVVLDNTLTGNEAKVNFDTTLNTEHTYKLENNVYDGLELTLNVIAKTNEQDGSFIHLSEEYYNKYEKAVYGVRQVSIFTTSTAKTDGVRNRIKNMGYNSVVVAEIAQENVLDSIVAYLLILGIGYFLVGTFFVVFATLNHSQKSRSGDIEILRTIGATKAELKFSLIIQYLFIGLIAFVLSMILLIVLRFTTKGEFRLALEYLDFLDYIIVLVLVLAMSYLLSLLFIKGIFKKTVRKGLTDERRGQ